MRKIQYEELIQIASEEKLVNLSDVETVVNDLICGLDSEDEEFGDVDYLNSPRKKLRDISRLFNNSDLQILGTADDYHNVAVSYARQNIFDCACMILQCGLQRIPFSIDMLADLIRYGISSGQYHLCDEPYLTLSRISKSRWNWRAFSFSIDYLIEKINHIETDEEQYKLKHQALVLADQFIEKEKSDQAYFKKANILSVFYGEGEEELTEGDVLQIGLEQVRVAPKCALRLADIMFDKGEYQKSIENLQKCCINTFNPQPDINSSYAFLLLALSKASKIFSENQEGNNPEFEALVHSMYKDFHTAIRNGLNDTFSRTANTAIKVIEAQTGYEYPYTDAAVDDPYDF